MVTVQLDVVSYGCWALLKCEMISGGGTFPSTEKVPSSSLVNALFRVISLANLFQVDVHPTWLDLLNWCLPEATYRLFTELIGKWIACAGGILGVGPLRTHLSYIDSHNFGSSEKRKDFDCKPMAPNLWQKSLHGKHGQTEKHLGSSPSCDTSHSDIRQRYWFLSRCDSPIGELLRELFWKLLDSSKRISVRK